MVVEKLKRLIAKYKKMSEKKKETIKWSGMLAVFLLLWFTGWHRPVVAKMQQLVLLTGIIQADMKYEGSDEVVNAVFITEDGNRLELASLRGKVVFMNVWATWCPPCKAEMPGIQNLYESVDHDKVAFVMLSTDRDFEKARKYKKDKSFTFPIHQLGANLPAELQSSALPTTFVIDKEGKIQMTHKGMAQYDSDKFKKFINGLTN